MRLIDTHAHLDYLEIGVDNAVKLAQDQGVCKIVTVTVDPSNLETALDISSRFENVYATQGVHPHEAKLFTDNVLEKIKSNSSNKKVVAIGEIGLDYHYNHSPRDIQITAFEKQLDLASLLNLPVVIHSREAEEDTISVIKNFLPKLKRGVVFHSFSSNDKLSEFAISNGHYLGFNGMVTFNKSDNVRSVLGRTPVELILLETDCPYLAPAPHRGRENAPHLLPLILDRVAQVKQMDKEDLEQTIYSNSCTLFNI